MSIHVVPRKNKKGVTSFYLRYWEGSHHKNIPRHLYPKFKTRAEAEEYADSEKAKTHVLKHAKGLRTLEWMNQYHDFNDLLLRYTKWQKKEAPNSYQTNVTYLKNYVFPYFLGERGLANVNIWYKDYQKYRDWIEKTTIPKTGKNLTYSTINACIRTLNGFIRFLVEYDLIEPMPGQIKCRGFDQSLVNKGARSFKDVITSEEYEFLKQDLVDSKDFFIVLYNTGMRFNELYSLPLSAVKKGDEIISEITKNAFHKLGKKIYGYIYLESQLNEDGEVRNKKTGKLKRKPLKGRKEISHANSRTIPITDIDTWEVLRKYHAAAKKSFEMRQQLSSDPQDYLLFNVDKNKLRREFSSKSDKQFHGARHSFTTYLVADFLKEGLNGETIVRSITGHESDAFEGYVHVVEEMNMKSGKNSGIEDL